MISAPRLVLISGLPLRSTPAPHRLPKFNPLIATRFTGLGFGRIKVSMLSPVKIATGQSHFGRKFASLCTTSRCLSKQAVIFSPQSRVKPYCEIPAKRSLLSPSLRLLMSGGPSYLHEHCDKLHQELGPIFRDKLGATEIVFLADTKLIQTVMANEGQYPHHNVPPAWTYYNKVNQVQRGLFFQSGESWLKLRRAFNKVMLDPQNIYRFGKDILKINYDLLQTWSKAKESTNTHILIEDIKSELCRWSIEATCFMLFGNRLGCITNSSRESCDSRVEELVRNVADMFIETSHFQILPIELAHRLNLPVWRRFESATTNMLKIANELARENMEKVRGGDNKSILQDLLNMRVLSEDDVSRSVVDLIIAAADTTSNSLQWILYLLAKHQRAQTRILEEIGALSLDTVNLDDINDKSPYLKAFVKEALRLYPTAPFLARSLEKDIILDDYAVPAGTLLVFSLYTTSRMERYFKDPLEFRPERWLRDSEEGLCRRNNYAYASLPFGVGARMCIGRRAADFEMYLFIASFINEFECSLTAGDNVGVKLEMILCPDKPINLLIKARNCEAIF